MLQQKGVAKTDAWKFISSPSWKEKNRKLFRHRSNLSDEGQPTRLLLVYHAPFEHPIARTPSPANQETMYTQRLPEARPSDRVDCNLHACDNELAPSRAIPSRIEGIQWLRFGQMIHDSCTLS